MRVLRLLAVTIVAGFLAAPTSASAGLRVKVVSVFSENPNDAQSFRVGAIKVRIGDVAVTTGDDTDDRKCLGGTSFRHPCLTSADCPGGTCGNPGDNDGDGHDEEELGIARTLIEPGAHLVGIDTAELRDESGNAYRVGSVRVEETVTALGKLCRPAVEPEGNVPYEFDANVDHSSQSDYTIAIRIVPLAAPDFTGGERCTFDGGTSTKAIAKCRRTIVKASAGYYDAVIAISTDCALKQAAGKLDPNKACQDDPDAGKRLEKSDAAFRKSIDKACGGKDKTCGGDSEDEVTPAQIGYASCPTFHGVCGGSVADCGDIAPCLECISEFGALTVLDPLSGLGKEPHPDKPIRKCQQKILRETSRYTRGESKFLSRCYEDLLEDPQSECGADLAPVAKLLTKLTKSICNACGGKEQKGCGGDDDFHTSLEIGYPVRCPAIGQCGSDVKGLLDIAGCHVCLSLAVEECVKSAASPSAGTYPSTCE